VQVRRRRRWNPPQHVVQPLRQIQSAAPPPMGTMSFTGRLRKRFQQNDQVDSIREIRGIFGSHPTPSGQ